jgi:DNA-binding GntR family transcriptional regulator
VTAVNASETAAGGAPRGTEGLTYASKSDIVTARLRSLIQTGELPPGAVLRQRDLAKRFGVSPTPVREALRRLEAEGFVATELHREATVVGVDDTQLRESLLIMANLESLAAALAAEKVTDEDLADIVALHEELSTLPTGDPAITELNRRFHFRIYECARSPVLSSLLNLLWRSATAQMPPAMRPHAESVGQHESIVAALRQRSSEAAAEATRDHIMDAASRPRPTAAG